MGENLNSKSSDLKDLKNTQAEIQSLIQKVEVTEGKTKKN